jgi:beta-lactam-binding protein with PASTA domain
MSAAQNVTASFTAVPPVRQCVVPKLKGKKLTAAKKKIHAAACKLGHVAKKKGVTPKTGKVVKQSPKVGSIKPAGAKVSLKLG